MKVFGEFIQIPLFLLSLLDETEYIDVYYYVKTKIVN